MGMTEQEKREKVINGLGRCVEYFANYGKGVMFYEWLEESRKAIALLKAQEPVEPVTSEEQYGDHLRHCPSCGKALPNSGEYGKSCYCYKCGQAVKWE